MIYLLFFLFGIILAFIFEYLRNIKKVKYKDEQKKCQKLLDNLNKEDWNQFYVNVNHETIVSINSENIDVFNKSAMLYNYKKLLKENYFQSTSYYIDYFEEVFHKHNDYDDGKVYYKLTY